MEWRQRGIRPEWQERIGMDSTTGSRKARTAQRQEGPAKAEGTRQASCGKEYLSGGTEGFKMV